MKSNTEIIRSTRIICLLQIHFCFFALGIFTVVDHYFQLRCIVLESLIVWLSVTVIIIAVVDHFQFQKRIQKAVNLPLADRVKAYRSATISRFVVIESVSVLFGTLFLLTGSLVFQLESALGAFLMLYFFPSILKTAKDLNISVQELEEPT